MWEQLQRAHQRTLEGSGTYAQPLTKCKLNKIALSQSKPRATQGSQVQRVTLGCLGTPFHEGQPGAVNPGRRQGMTTNSHTT